MICRQCLRATRMGVRARTALPANSVPRSRLTKAMPMSTVPSFLATAHHMPSPLAASRYTSPTTNPRPYSTSASSEATPMLSRPEGLTDGEAAVWDLLSTEFAPTELQVQDVSGGCGSMYSIDITSEKFRGLNMLKQQRVVNSVLADMVKEWHGLQLRTRVP